MKYWVGANKPTGARLIHLIAISVHESLKNAANKSRSPLYNGFIKSKRISEDLDLHQLQKKPNKLRLKRTTKMGSPSHTKSLCPIKSLTRKKNEKHNAKWIALSLLKLLFFHSCFIIIAFYNFQSHLHLFKTSLMAHAIHRTNN